MIASRVQRSEQSATRRQIPEILSLIRVAFNFNSAVFIIDLSLAIREQSAKCVLEATEFIVFPVESPSAVEMIASRV